MFFIIQIRKEYYKILSWIIPALKNTVDKQQKIMKKRSL